MGEFVFADFFGGEMISADNGHRAILFKCQTVNTMDMLEGINGLAHADLRRIVGDVR
jgi:hypothetical protein